MGLLSSKINVIFDLSPDGGCSFGGLPGARRMEQARKSHLSGSAGPKQGLFMSISNTFSIRTRAILSLFVLLLVFVPHASALWEGDVESNPQLNALWLAMRMPNQRGQWVFLPFDENREIHKGFDGTVSYVSASDSVGAPVDHTEAEIGFALDLTEFTREGDTLHFNMAVESRQITGWKSTGMMFRPVFQTKSFHTTSDSGPRSVQCGEWNCLIPGEEATPGIPEMCIGPLSLFLPD